MQTMPDQQQLISKLLLLLPLLQSSHLLAGRPCSRLSLVACCASSCSAAVSSALQNTTATISTN
jgi:hypothetical protein